MTMPKRETSLSDRDLAILKFLFRFKVTSTLAIHHRFLPHTTVNWTYKRLRILEKSRFIQCTVEKHGRHYVWTLDKNGFQALRQLWPKLKDHGYGSENINHDLLASAAHIGDFLTTETDLGRLFTEQELRRYDKHFFPDWVPNSYRHRPDGYWQIDSNTGIKTIALELELSVKKKVMYKAVADFYRDYPVVWQVIWITGTVGVLKYVRNALLEALGEKSSNHNFMLLSDFLKTQWQTPVAIGPLKDLTLAQILNSSKSNRGPTLDPGWILDTRKAPIKSPSFVAPNLSKFIY